MRFEQVLPDVAKNGGAVETSNTNQAVTPHARIIQIPTKVPNCELV
jgi:hypothetical protein